MSPQNILHKEPHRSIVYLATLILIKSAIQIALFQRGFISVSADEFSRGIRAAKWANSPTINISADIQSTWLPFERYLNGLLLQIWPDVIVTPRFTVFVASSLLLIVYYLLAYYLFQKFTIASVSTLIIAFQPWYVWLSGTPMLEMYYFPFFFAGLLFLLIWLNKQNNEYWIAAGVCFLLASGFHVQSWVFINLTNLLILPYLFQFVKQKNYGNVKRLIAYYFLSNAFIIGFALTEYWYTGDIFAFLETHTNYSKWVYQGYDVPLLDKLLYYPEIIIRNSSTPIWLFLAIGLVFMIKRRERIWKWIPLLLALFALTTNSLMNTLSGPPSAAPDRYSLFFILIISLYSTYGFYYVTVWIWQRSLPKLIKYVLIIVPIGLLFYSLFWSAMRIPDYPRGMALDSVEVGRVLNRLLTQNPGNYMVELIYWDYLAVNLASEHYDEMVYDRELDYLDRNTPSIFLQPSAVVCDALTSQNVRYLALADDALKQQAQQINILELTQTIDRWAIYQVALDAQERCQ